MLVVYKRVLVFQCYLNHSSDRNGNEIIIMNIIRFLYTQDMFGCLISWFTSTAKVIQRPLSKVTSESLVKSGIEQGEWLKPCATKASCMYMYLWSGPVAERLRALFLNHWNISPLCLVWV